MTGRSSLAVRAVPDGDATDGAASDSRRATDVGRSRKSRMASAWAISAAVLAYFLPISTALFASALCPVSSAVNALIRNRDAARSGVTLLIWVKTSYDSL